MAYSKWSTVCCCAVKETTHLLNKVFFAKVGKKYRYNACFFNIVKNVKFCCIA